jgi:hypothetical protein
MHQQLTNIPCFEIIKAFDLQNYYILENPAALAHNFPKPWHTL